MIWSETQALLQMAVALNFAYFTFKEIRNPVSNRFESKHYLLTKCLERKKEWLDDKKRFRKANEGGEVQWISYFKKYLDVYERLCGVKNHKDSVFRGMNEIERRATYPTLAVTLFSLVMLIHSTFNSHSHISNGWVAAIMTIAFLPTAAFVSLNFAMMFALQDKLWETLSQLDEEISAFFPSELESRLWTAVADE